MSKCVPFSSATVESSRSWFQRWNASTPSIARAGSDLEVLDHGVDVGTRDDALRDLSHRALDAVQLVPTPRVRLVEVERDPVEVLRVERVAVAPDRVTLVGAWCVLLHEEATERRVGLGGPRRQASRAGRAARRRRGPTRRTRRRACGRTAGCPGSSPPQVSACLVHATACRRAATTPWAAPSARAASMLDRPCGTSAMRSAITCQSSAVSRAIRSNAMRTVCTGLPSTRRSRSRSPASYSVSANSSRSRITSAAMRSASVCTSPTSTWMASSARSVARSSSARSAAPSGEKSVISWSCPLMPSPVADSGSRAANRST